MGLFYVDAENRSNDVGSATAYGCLIEYCKKFRPIPETRKFFKRGWNYVSEDWDAEMDRIPLPDEEGLRGLVSLFKRVVRNADEILIVSNGQSNVPEEEMPEEGGNIVPDEDE